MQVSRVGVQVETPTFQFPGGQQGLEGSGAWGRTHEDLEWDCSEKVEGTPPGYPGERDTWATMLRGKASAGHCRPSPTFHTCGCPAQKGMKGPGSLPCHGSTCESKLLMKCQSFGLLLGSPGKTKTCS